MIYYRYNPTHQISRTEEILLNFGIAEDSKGYYGKPRKQTNGSLSKSTQFSLGLNFHTWDTFWKGQFSAEVSNAGESRRKEVEGKQEVGKTFKKWAC